jgi:hypothetical protein
MHKNEGHANDTVPVTVQQQDIKKELTNVRLKSNFSTMKSRFEPQNNAQNVKKKRTDK